jgi:hypothetical protein
MSAFAYVIALALVFSITAGVLSRRAESTQ